MYLFGDEISRLSFDELGRIELQFFQPFSTRFPMEKHSEANLLELYQFW